VDNWLAYPRAADSQADAGTGACGGAVLHAGVGSENLAGAAGRGRHRCWGWGWGGGGSVCTVRYERGEGGDALLLVGCFAAGVLGFRV
jgi:hypothetical protein